MITLRNHTASILFPLITAILPCFMVTCTQEQQETHSKIHDRNLMNATSTFIYNMVPENAQADITPEYSTAINTFSVKLLNEVYKNELYLNKNVVLSPFCVSRNLAIITEATTGTSQQELLNVLGGRTALDDATSALSSVLYGDKSVILQCSDGIWVDSTRYSLLPSFKDLANTKYGVDAAGLNFDDAQGTADAINKWIAVNTSNRITNAVDRNYIGPLTTLFLTSTIYFEADWTSPFDVTKTRSQPFSSPTGSVEAAMMSSSYLHQIRKTGEYENVKLYYGTVNKNFFYLDIYMPTAMSVTEFIDRKCLTALGDRDSFQYGGLIMPKFFFETEIDLKSILKNMGAKGVFDPGKSEINGMASAKGDRDSAALYIEFIMHKAGIKTDEEGTVAYAVTVTAIAGGSDTMSPDVILDKPFVYFIRAGVNGLVLFAGVVNNPNDRM
jgi:serine protease inhibitor